MKKLFLTSMLLTLSLMSASCSTTAESKKDDGPQAYKAVTPDEAVTPKAEAKKEGSLKDKISSCTCVKIWMPVCGENKRTYGNSCEADCVGVKYTAGACQADK